MGSGFFSLFPHEYKANYKVVEKLHPSILIGKQKVLHPPSWQPCITALIF